MPVISVKNLGKKYTIGKNGAASEGLRHAIHDFFTTPFHALRRNGRPSTVGGHSEDFWALKDVSFEVKQGEVVGIIGRNGAGKSTLLKILSRITEPTTGRLGIRGRVASLLEVGTGFHPELTGRENVFLNGAILGMTREEIKRKFDEIVAFAEIEKFIDTPVKRYSSGMYVRLAFAVAAHLEPEILIIDEVLAVGDAQFQQKCLGKMEQVGKDGRTVLFVSHNMTAIETLCTRVVQLKSGELVSQGSGAAEQIRDYLSSIQEQPEITGGNTVALGPNLILRKCDFLPNPIMSGDKQEFTIEISSAKSELIRSLVILVYSSMGQRVAIIDLRPATGRYILGNDSLTITGQIECLPLVEGEYHVGLYVESDGACRDFMSLSKVTVIGAPGSSKVVPYPAHVRGLVELTYTSQVSPQVGLPEQSAANIRPILT
jgi:lipopolysaccharide transport system ATP-binding protein